MQRTKQMALTLPYARKPSRLREHATAASAIGRKGGTGCTLTKYLQRSNGVCLVLVSSTRNLASSQSRPLQLTMLGDLPVASKLEAVAAAAGRLSEASAVFWS